jgi:hypothetical protein
MSTLMAMADSTGPPGPEPETSPPGEARTAPPEIDVSKPHPARMYDYLPGW